MPDCPDCEAEIDVDDFDVDRGDRLSCPECGVTLEVVSLSPIELDVRPDEYDHDSPSATDDEDEETDDSSD